MQKAALLAACVALLSAGISPALAQPAYKYVITLQLNVNTELACPDYLAPGSPNDAYLGVLGNIVVGTAPTIGCRQIANTVHTMELIGPQDGSNFLFDDPRKVSQAVADFRTISVTNRVSLQIWYQYGTDSPEVGQSVFVTLDDNVRSGAFLDAVVASGADAAAPLLEAVTFQQLYAGCTGVCY